MRNTIENMNEVLDASFSSRRRFFRKQVESLREDKAARVVWTTRGATDYDITDNQEEKNSGFFAGTLHRNSFSASNASESRCEGKERSISCSSLNPHGGNSSTRKKIEIRRNVFRRSSISLSDLEVEKSLVLSSKSINSLRNESILCRKVEANVISPTPTSLCYLNN